MLVKLSVAVTVTFGVCVFPNQLVFMLYTFAKLEVCFGRSVLSRKMIKKLVIFSQDAQMSIRWCVGSFVRLFVCWLVGCLVVRLFVCWLVSSLVVWLVGW